MNTRKVQIIQRLRDHFDLPAERAEALLDEVLDALDETVDEYVQSRHAQLQQQGWSNAEIYSRLQLELQELRFAPPTLSDRQLRRRIYG